MSIKGFKDEYRWLSNFWPCKINYEGITYPSVEHAYVAAKTNDLNSRLKLLTLTAGQAKKIGRTFELRKDWNEVRLDIMRNFINQKFAEGTELSLKLDSTGDCYIEETNDWGDVFFGVCNGVGSNHLGTLIMEARDSLRSV